MILYSRRRRLGCVLSCLLCASLCLAPAKGDSRTGSYHELEDLRSSLAVALGTGRVKSVIGQNPAASIVALELWPGRPLVLRLRLEDGVLSVRKEPDFLILVFDHPTDAQPAAPLDVVRKATAKVLADAFVPGIDASVVVGQASAGAEARIRLLRAPRRWGDWVVAAYTNVSDERVQWSGIEMVHVMASDTQTILAMSILKARRAGEQTHAATEFLRKCAEIPVGDARPRTCPAGIVAGDAVSVHTLPAALANACLWPKDADVGAEVKLVGTAGLLLRQAVAPAADKGSGDTSAPQYRAMLAALDAVQPNGEGGAATVQRVFQALPQDPKLSSAMKGQLLTAGVNALVRAGTTAARGYLDQLVDAEHSSEDIAAIIEAVSKALPKGQATDYCLGKLKAIAENADATPAKAIALMRCLPGSLAPDQTNTLLMVIGKSRMPDVQSVGYRILTRALIDTDDGRADVVRILRERLADGDPVIRAIAARGLGAAGDVRLVRNLAPLLDDPAYKVRATAASAVCRLLNWKAPELREGADGPMITELKTRLTPVLDALEVLGTAARQPTP